MEDTAEPDLALGLRADELLEAGTPSHRHRRQGGMPRQACELLPTMLRAAEHAAQTVTSARRAISLLCLLC
jgi:hypothetical protein